MSSNHSSGNVTDFSFLVVLWDERPRNQRLGVAAEVLFHSRHSTRDPHRPPSARHSTRLQLRLAALCRTQRTLACPSLELYHHDPSAQSVLGYHVVIQQHESVVFSDRIGFDPIINRLVFSICTRHPLKVSQVLPLGA